MRGTKPDPVRPGREEHDRSEVIDLVTKGRISVADAFDLWNERAAARRPAPTGRCPVRSPGDAGPALSELDSLVGLASVKRLVREICAFVRIQARRRGEGLAAEPLVLHMVFKGNPGTGKTTVARILGRTFKELGVLERGHLVEVERADLVGEYIGHTAQRTREQIRQAMGGILFIDEAYSLARGGEKDFGKEAIDALVKSMEDHKENLVLILAGYTNEMDYFLCTNPGLRSRFPIHMDFPDFDAQELLAIADLMLRKRQYRLSAASRARLKEILEERSAFDGSVNGNARMVRNLIERAVRRQAMRLADRAVLTRDDLMLILPDDLEGEDGS